MFRVSLCVSFATHAIDIFFITFNLCNVFFFYNADDQLLLSSFENIV